MNHRDAHNSRPRHSFAAVLIVLLAILGFAPHADASPGRNTYPPVMPEAEAVVYKTAGEVELKLYIFEPEGHTPEAKRPAIVFFFGGGWKHGSPQQFYEICRYFASRGMVAIAADYRVRSRHQAGIDDCIADAKSAMRYVRQHANERGIDPDRIAAGGSSAGGHLAAATAMLPGHDDKADDTAISPRPAALVLLYPAAVIAPVDDAELTEAGKKFLAPWPASCRPLSPYHHIREDLPPTLIFHGTADRTVPAELSEAFTKKMKKMGNDCELVKVANAGHRFSEEQLADALNRADEFLQRLGMLEGEANAGQFMKALRSE